MSKVPAWMPTAGAEGHHPQDARLGRAWCEEVWDAFAYKAAHARASATRSFARAQVLLHAISNENETAGLDFMRGAQLGVYAMLDLNAGTAATDAPHADPVRVMATVLVCDSAGGFRAMGDYWWRTVFLALEASDVGLEDLAYQHADEAAATVTTLLTTTRTPADAHEFLYGVRMSLRARLEQGPVGITT